MTKMELGQSYHHEFWTIGLNVHGVDCRLPKSEREMENIFSVGRHEIVQPAARGRARRSSPRSGNGIGAGAVEVDGEFPDLSKKFAFEPYLDLPKRVPEARFELAMNINADDPEQARLRDAAGTLSIRTASRGRRRISAISGERAWRVHGDQRRGCELADRLAERSGGGVSGARPAGHYRGHRRGKISAA